MTKKTVNEYLYLDKEIDGSTVQGAISFLTALSSRHVGEPEDMYVFLGDYSLRIQYSRLETDEEESTREAKEASEKHRRHVQYLKLKEEFDP